MNTWLGRGLAALLALCLLAGPAVGKPRGVALVIGNSDYDDAPLSNPINDAQVMAVTLTQMGFEVMHKADLDQRGLKRAIRDFGEALASGRTGSVGLFYYAGHGIQVDGENYLVPVGAEITRESDVEIEAVSANGVLTTLEKAGADLNIVILDACRNNPYARSWRSGSQGLARMDAPQGTLVAYATAPGRLAADGSGGNSPYTEALVAAMRKPGVPIEQVFKQVRVSVMETTDDQQVPWESSSLTGDFYFTPGDAVARADAPAASGGDSGGAATPAPNAEIVFWQSIEDSDDPAQFELYLKSFPDGLFVDLAKRKIEQLKQPKTARATDRRPPPPERKPPPPDDMARAPDRSVPDGPRVPERGLWTVEYRNDLNAPGASGGFCGKESTGDFEVRFEDGLIKGTRINDQKVRGEMMTGAIRGRIGRRIVYRAFKVGDRYVGRYRVPDGECAGRIVFLRKE